MKPITSLYSLLILSLLLLLNYSRAQAQHLVPLPPGPETSLRGLSVVNDSVAWISGSSGWTASTADAGRTWQWQQAPGYQTLDFRDIEAFSAERAVMVSAGSPAVILRTADGGRTWQEVYRNESPDIFLDGMDFWDDQRGLLYGDPIAGQMQLLQTLDGGQTWQNISPNIPVPLKEGEASFAASGTGIRTLGRGHAWIATGGRVSRVFHSTDYGRTWVVHDLPILQGKPSTGPFSIAFFDPKRGVAAGGDYQMDTLRQDNFRRTTDGGRSWHAPKQGPFGYRSAVEYVSKNTIIATCTSGTDISTDGGRSWQRLSPEGYHTVRKAKAGNWVLLTGSKGRIATLKR
ncbi:oxidoreductase [soil metagenome]